MLWLEESDQFLLPLSMNPGEPVAIGIGLSPQKILKAYKMGIFPWEGFDNFITWWSPDPRMVLEVDEFKCSRSLAKTLRSHRFTVQHNTAFHEVMSACATVARRGQKGRSWITEEFIDAYGALRQMGYAHSFETFENGVLVGGLYGLLIGRFFFGESMFATKTDASKVALAHLVLWLKERGVKHIDCQQQTAHLASLGAKPVPRATFLEWVAKETHST